MTIQIRKATRQKAKLRLGIAAPSGAGKTYGALLLAFGLGGKIGMIDTEHGSGDLYEHLGDYDIISLAAPFTVAKYLEAIKAFEDAKYDVIIIDSLSHAWAGDGGLLDKQGKIADASKNSYTAWRQVTPEHNALVEAMLQSPAHIIATMRSKVEYVLEVNEKGKQAPRKVGMAPVQREGMDYEFTVVFDVDHNHNTSASKDRTELFDKRIFTISKETGVELKGWLDTGVDADAAYNDLLGTFRADIKKAKSAKALNEIVGKIQTAQHWKDSRAILGQELVKHGAELNFIFQRNTLTFIPKEAPKDNVTHLVNGSAQEERASA